ncbi:hypothetical protein [Butyrivibrio proteoclasticus]|uniref:hypothetical protein n=1 Tax=Butyrivibrio proteoclasticus TaxID=43305 RepID=UPI00047AB7C7|nr:hypothetical protein [Butyrivibrio proteoclasticus]
MKRIIEKGCIVDDSIWYTNAIVNGLFKFDIRSGQVNFVGTPEGDDPELERAYSEVIYFDEKIYLIPFNAPNIAVYDLKSRHFSTIEYPEEVNTKVYSATFIGNKIYLLPYLSQMFYCIDAETNSLEQVKELNVYPFSRDAYSVLTLQSVAIGNVLYFFDGKGDTLYSFDTQNKSILGTDLKKYSKRFITVCKKENKIYATSIDGEKMVIVDIIKGDEDIADLNNDALCWIGNYKDKIVLLKLGDDCLRIFDTEKQLESPENEHLGNVFFNMICNGDYCFTLPTTDNKAFYQIGKGTIPFDDKKAMKEWMLANGIFREKEDEACDLNYYLSYIAR